MLVNMTLFLRLAYSSASFTYVIDMHQSLEATPEVTERMGNILGLHPYQDSPSEHLSYTGLLFLR